MRKIRRRLGLLGLYAILAVLAEQAVYQFDRYLHQRFDGWLKTYGERVDYRHLRKPLIEREV